MTDPETANQTVQKDDTIAVVPAQTTPPPSTYRATTMKAQETARTAYRLLKFALFVLIGFVLALFVFRNWEDVSFDYVFGDANLPLAVVMLIFTAIGVAMGVLIYWILARRTRKS